MESPKDEERWIQNEKWHGDAHGHLTQWQWKWQTGIDEVAFHS